MNVVPDLLTEADTEKIKEQAYQILEGEYWRDVKGICSAVKVEMNGDPEHALHLIEDAISSMNCLTNVDGCLTVLRYSANPNAALFRYGGCQAIDWRYGVPFGDIAFAAVREDVIAILRIDGFMVLSPEPTQIFCLHRRMST